MRMVRIPLILIFLFMGFFIIKKINYSDLEPNKPALVALPTGTLIRTNEEIRPFSLLTQENEIFDINKIKGEWSLVFFGYTYCPEFCPKLFSSMDRIGQHLKSLKLNYYVISIDPQRDTPERLKEFFSRYKTPIKGITGDLDMIHQLAADLKLTVEKAQGYEQHIEHSAALVLINPEGKIRGILREYLQPKDMAKDIRYIITS